MLGSSYWNQNFQLVWDFECLVTYFWMIGFILGNQNFSWCGTVLEC